MTRKKTKDISRFRTHFHTFICVYEAARNYRPTVNHNGLGTAECSWQVFHFITETPGKRYFYFKKV